MLSYSRLHLCQVNLPGDYSQQFIAIKVLNASMGQQDPKLTLQLPLFVSNFYPRSALCCLIRGHPALKQLLNSCSCRCWDRHHFLTTSMCVQIVILVLKLQNEEVHSPISDSSGCLQSISLCESQCLPQCECYASFMSFIL